MTSDAVRLSKQLSWLLRHGAGGRSHVHLASHHDSRVGKRSSVDLLLEVSANRLTDFEIAVFRAPNGVLLVRWVPPNSIVGLRTETTSGAQAEERSRNLLRLHRD